MEINSKDTSIIAEGIPSDSSNYSSYLGARNNNVLHQGLSIDNDLSIQNVESVEISTVAQAATVAREMRSPSILGNDLFHGLQAANECLINEEPLNLSCKYSDFDAKTICINSLKRWKGIPQESVFATRITGGQSNYLWKVEVNDDSVFPLSVIVRFFGNNTEKLVCRDREELIMHHLGRQNLGPRILFNFNDGRIEKLLGGRSLTFEQIRDESISQKIAQALSRFHHTDVPGIDDEGDLWITLSSWIGQLDELPPFPPVGCRFGQSEPPSFGMNSFSLINLMKSIMNNEAALRSPSVLCHNDLQPGNILFSSISNTDHGCTLIDFEYSTCGPRGFDIANHFREWEGEPPEERCPPSPTEKINFIRAYLSPDNPRGALSSEVEDIVQEVDCFTPLSDLFWGVWAIHRAFEEVEAPTIDYDFGVYAAYRLGKIAWGDN